MAGKIQTAVEQAPERATMIKYINTMEGAIKRALPSVITPERFTRIVTSALSANPTLAKCTPQSFLAAMMTSAQLGMEVNTPLGQAYLIPFRNHGVLECQFQLGYKGMIDLAYRSGDVSVIQAKAVHENDLFECEFGIEPKLRHVPAEKDRGEVTRYYALFRTKDGGYGFEVMSVEDVRKHAAKFSKSYSDSFSPWKTNFDEMAKKTVLKRVLKYAPMKSDFIRGVMQDETVKTQIDPDMTTVPGEEIIEGTGELIDEEPGFPEEGAEVNA